MFPNVGTITKAVTTAGTKVQFVSAVGTKARRVYITAWKANTKPITIGDTNVIGAVSGRRGVSIEPGATLLIEGLSDLFTLFMDSEVNGEGVGVMYQW